MVKYMAVVVAVAVSWGGRVVAVAVPVAGLTKRFFNNIQKDFSINVWGYESFSDNVPDRVEIMSVVGKGPDSLHKLLFIS